MPKKSFWFPEATQYERYDESGSLVIQMTSACSISNNVYCEQPYTSSDGKRAVVIRSNSTDYHDPWDLYMLDLETGRMTFAQSQICGCGMGAAAWGDWFYYLKDMPEGKKLFRTSLLTLEEEEMFEFGDCPLPRMSSGVSPDHRYYLGVVYPPNYSIVRIDLLHKKWKIIHQDPEILNPHVQFDLTGENILIQQNRGGLMDDQDNWIRGLGPEGCTCYLLDREGNNKRSLAIGPPFTPSCTGHECFVPGTDSVVFTTSQRVGDNSNLYTATVGDEQTRVVCKEPVSFAHISASKCGRYFITDSHSRLIVI